MKPRIRLTVGQLRKLAKDYDLANILNPTEEDQKQMLTLDFLADFVAKGTEHLGKAAPDVENIDVKELLAIFKTWNEEPPEETAESGK